MSARSPAADCCDLAFRAGYPITEPAEVALEDYACSLLSARAAEGLRAVDDAGLVRGVHLCGLGASPTPALLNDLEDFARSLVAAPGGSGLGWS